MKRLFAVLTLCATALMAASAVLNPAAAGERHDGRRQAGHSDRQMSWNTTNRGGRHHKAQRRHERQRYTRRYAQQRARRHDYGHRHAYGYNHRHGYAYGPPRYRYGTRTRATYALQLDGASFFFRID